MNSTLLRTRRFLAVAAAVSVAMAVVATGCGGGTSSADKTATASAKAPATATKAPSAATATKPPSSATTVPPSATTPPASTAAPGGAGTPSAGTPTLLIGQVASLGSVLTDPSGKTLYTYKDDVPNSGQSSVPAAIAPNWPPLLVTGSVVPPPGLTGQLGSFALPDGSMQVMYKGMPLYTFVADTAPGDAKRPGAPEPLVRSHSVANRGRGRAASPPGACSAAPLPSGPRVEIAPPCCYLYAAGDWTRAYRTTSSRRLQ